jgi:hypothetical protein
MTCLRCQGLMVEDHFFDFEGTYGLMWMKGWRCLNCGYAVDPLLEANRRLHESTRLWSTSNEAVLSAGSWSEHDTQEDAEAA